MPNKYAGSAVGGAVASTSRASPGMATSLPDRNVSLLFEYLSTSFITLHQATSNALSES